MKTTGVREGDLLHCDVRGQRFYARAETGAVTDELRGRGVRIGALNGKPLLAYFVTAREIVGHYSKRKGSV